MEFEPDSTKRSDINSWPKYFVVLKYSFQSFVVENDVITLGVLIRKWRQIKYFPHGQQIL